MTKGPGYLLPTVISPTATRCITLEIPDDPGHIRAFLAQLDMLSFWWTWKRDALKQGTQAARRWQSVVDSARQQLDFFGECPVGFDIRIQDCILQKSLDGGETWIDVADLGDCAGEGPQGPAGPQGLPGADGADGQPVELRTYFGTVQWRVVGTEVWNHLLNLSEITGPAGADGADGQPVELRTYFGTVQWRVVGTEVWNHLMNLDEICDCEEPEPTNPNPLTDGLLCAIAYRVASEIRRVWDYAFTNPENVISNLATGTGTAAAVVALLFPGVAATAAIIGTISGFAGFLAQVFDDSEANSFTLATEYYIAGLIYCELVRRQQRTIDKDLLIDIAPDIEDAPDLTEQQKTALISFILAAPLVAWSWAAQATAPYPDGSACAATVCPDDTDDFWCVQLFDDSPIYADFLAFHPLLQQGMVTINVGRLSGDSPESYVADSNYGYPFLPDIVDPYPQRELRLQLTFPRPTRIDRLQFEVLYNQTAATAIGNLLKVVSDDGTTLINQTTSGVTGGGGLSETFEWWGDKEVKSLTITGQVWATDLWADIGAQLRVTSFKIQGQDYNPFKPLTNCVWEVPPPLEIPEHDWTATFNFMESSQGFTAGSGNGGVEGAYIPGLGWRTTFTDFYQFEGIVMDIGRAFAIYSGVVAFAMSYSRQNLNGAAPYIRISNPQSQANFPNDSHGIRTDLVSYPPMNVGSGVRIRIICASVDDDSLNGTEGEAIVYQLRMYGTGTRPAGFAGVPD